MKKNQNGFTLVEIAIVLVIVGLLLGGVLKGQELIFNSKVKATFNLSKELSAAASGYQDRYKQFPGDDPNALTRFPTYTPAVVNGNGDGIVQTGLPCTLGSGSTENCRALSHLRAAGFINGTGTDAIRTPFGGATSIHSAQFGTGGGGSALVMALAPGSLTHKAASAIDTSFDDGVPTRGTLRCSGVVNYNLNTPDQSMPGWCHISM